MAVQGVIIPVLRREQIRLGKRRQIASRQLAGRIGEIVESSPAIRAHGTDAYERSEIGERLAGLFFIRLDLYNRKFAVKFLNNLLAQLTPFFFYTVGGYLALQGKLDVGQLVAVIAAYRDLPPPVKELIDWDQQRADVTVKYDQIIQQFDVDEPEGAEELAPHDPRPAGSMSTACPSPTSTAARWSRTSPSRSRAPAASCWRDPPAPAAMSWRAPSLTRYRCGEARSG